MSNSLQTTTALLDIEPPELPAESNFANVVTGFTLLFILVVFIVLGIRRYFSPRAKARRQLHQLQRKCMKNIREISSSPNADGEDDNRETSYQLARLLATGLGLNGVTISTPLPGTLDHLQERWRLFTGELSAARYEQPTSRPGCLDNLDSLFKDSLFFLKNWP
jgi:hypothetical protein